MKRIIKWVVYIIKNLCNTLLYLIELLRYNCLFNRLKEKHDGSLVLLANGPSLKEIIHQLSCNNKFSNVDFIVLNFFAFEPSFFKIKPKHYCFVDPMFFYKTHRYNDVVKLYTILQDKVNWNMNIYIPQTRYSEFVKFCKINNPYIKIQTVNNIQYRGFNKFKYFLFKEGLAMPLNATVANMAIYVGITLGYKKIYLYGVDHTFFDSLTVNEKNELCNKDTHFYNNSETVLKPIIRNDNGTVWKISEYLESITNMFKSHDDLSKYAEYKKIEIFNCTNVSLIDSYKRLIEN